jgi:hypothetical protein
VIFTQSHFWVQKGITSSANVRGASFTKTKGIPTDRKQPIPHQPAYNKDRDEAWRNIQGEELDQKLS